MRLQPFPLGQRAWASLAASTVVLFGLNIALLPEPAQALCRRGAFTLFGGVDRDLVLPHRICNNQPSSGNAVYELQVPGERINGAVIEIEVNYNPIFTHRFRGGSFNIDQISVIDEDGQEVALSDIIWDRDASRVELYPIDPIPAATDFTIIFADVYNPRRYQQNLFNLKVLYQGEGLRRLIGTWPLELAAETSNDR